MLLESLNIPISKGDFDSGIEVLPKPDSYICDVLKCHFGEIELLVVYM